MTLLPFKVPVWKSKLERKCNLCPERPLYDCEARAGSSFLNNELQKDLGKCLQKISDQGREANNTMTDVASFKSGCRVLSATSRDEMHPATHLIDG